ncbi:MAG: beta-L-arabinofuranosidase domain-containing protein, partial [Christensenellaceae bacterium]
LNSIWSSQNPETGMTTYFQPMATGYFKVYSTETTKFWCCTGSGMESFTKLNDSIYYHSDDSVYVSMYLDSTLNWSEKGVKLDMNADLEHSDTVTLSVAGSTKLCLRVPDWTESFAVTVNGTAVNAPVQDGYASLSVKNGDQVSVRLEKSFTAHTLPDGTLADGGVATAIKYGPYVLSAELGTEDMVTTTTGVEVTIPRDAVFESDMIEVSGTREAFFADLGSHFTIEGDRFILNDTDTPLTYSVHFRQYTQRYGVYLYFYSEGEKTSVTLPDAIEKEVYDTVQPGYGQYENDELHDMQEENSVGVTNDGTYRYALEGGSFTYRMAIDPDEENSLILTFRKADNGKTILIRSGDVTVYEATLQYNGGESYQVIVPIPQEAISAAKEIVVGGETKQVIELTFSGVDQKESARVCDFIYTAKVTYRLAYFVDCGDYDVTTVSDGDVLGVYNSVTEQLYGADSVTGKSWGLVDGADPTKGTAGSYAPNGISSSNTWAYEYNQGDNLAKTASNRYTKNQYECGVARNLSYAFELEDGDYIVELYFADPWGCSKKPSVAANGTTILSEVSVNKPVIAQVHVEGGKLTLDITSNDLCINVAYIRIYFA